MKKFLNILLVLLACFTINAYAANDRDTTDNDTCDPGVTYYNFYFFNAGERLNPTAHTDYTRPYDFFDNTGKYYNISCAGAINLHTTESTTERTQTVKNPSTCSGSVDGFSLNSWSINDYWTQMNNITDLYFNPSHSFSGWKPNEENYIFKKTDNAEIRLIIPGSSASTWNAAKYLKLQGIVAPIGEPPTLLPQTKVDMYFGEPNATTYTGICPFCQAHNSGDTSLMTNYISNPFQGNDTAKKFIVERDTPKIGSSSEPCNKTNSPGATCTYSYYSPVIYVIKYTCTDGPPKECDPETECCYKKETRNNSGGGTINNTITNLCKQPLYRLSHLAVCTANDLVSNASGGSTTETIGQYYSDLSGKGEGQYTYTTNGFFNNEYHSQSDNLILTECVETCDPTTQCCYVRNNQGLAGFLHAAEDSTDALTNIIEGVNNKIGVTDFLNGMKGLFGNDFGGLFNATDVAKNAANSLVDQLLGGSGAAANLKYQYTKELPKQVPIKTSFATTGATKYIMVDDTTNRYRALKVDANGNTTQVNLAEVSNSDNITMESCGCNPEKQCCYDSTGVTYSGFAGEITKATHDSNGNELKKEEIADIETYALIPAYNKASTMTSTVMSSIKNLFGNLTGTAQNTFTNLLGGFAGGLSFDNIQSTFGSIVADVAMDVDIDTPLLELFNGLPEYNDKGDFNQVRASENELYKQEGAIWPPIISGFTKNITDKNGNTLAVKSCGCDEEKECCYDKDGNYHYEYKGYNETRYGEVDPNPHYQRLELSDNPYYNENRDRGLLVNASAELQSFMQTTTKEVVKCKSYHISMDYVCTVDDYQEISSGQFIEAVPNRVDNDSSGNEYRTTDSWMKVLSRGGQTGVGYSILPESMKTLRYRGIDIVCADAYKVTYPGIQDSGEKGQFVAMANNNAYLTYNIDYDNKTAATKAPIVKIELKKTCVTTKGLSQRTFNLNELVENQINYRAQHAFFKNYLNYANLFGIDLDENQTSDTARRKQLADNITEYITGGDNPVVKARLYYDDYTTAFKDPKGYIDIELKAIKCPNIHKEFIEYNVDNETGKRDFSDLGIYCSDEGGYEIPNSDDSRSTPVYACSDTNLSNLQNTTGDNFYSRIFAQCVAIPFTDEFEDTKNTATILGQKLEQFWYDRQNGEWTVKDFFTKSENIVLYGSIPQTLVKGGTALTCMQGYCQNNPFDSEVVSLPNNSLPIGFDTTSGTKKYRIEVDIDMSKTRRMPTFQDTKPSQIPQNMWNKWKSLAGSSSIRDYALDNYNKNNLLIGNQAEVISPVAKKTVSSDGYLNTGEDNSKYTCSYSVEDELGNANYFYRTISLGNINPQNRKLGANWNYTNLASTKGKYNGLVQRIEAQKAMMLAGTSEESSEDNLFKQADDNYQVLTGKDKFTFKLTATTMRMIRRYNKLKMNDFSSTEEAQNSSVGNASRRGYSDWTLNVVDYNGATATAADQQITVFNNTDASTKWNVGFADTSGAASTKLPDYVYRRYNSETNDTGYHWYSPFIWCLYYGDDYCINVTPPVQSIVYDDAKIKNDIKTAFADYKSVSNNSEEWDLRANVKKLILKQNKLDNDAYKAVTTTSELLVSDARTTAIHLSPKHDATLIDFATNISAYVVEFGGLLIGVDTNGLVNAGGSVLGALIGSATGVNPWNLSTQEPGDGDTVLKGISNALGDWFQSGLLGDVVTQIAKNAQKGN